MIKIDKKKKKKRVNIYTIKPISWWLEVEGGSI
jgi:hypothetical protein